STGRWPPCRPASGRTSRRSTPRHTTPTTWSGIRTGPTMCSGPRPRMPQDEPAVDYPGTLPSLQGVEPHRAPGQHLAPRLGGHRPEPLAEHLRRAREEAVLMGIIGRPHDLVRADIVGQHGDASLDRLERDPAIALEELARP